jgi:hypothetical protein
VFLITPYFYVYFLYKILESKKGVLKQTLLRRSNRENVTMKQKEKNYYKQQEMIDL